MRLACGKSLHRPTPPYTLAFRAIFESPLFEVLDLHDTQLDELCLRRRELLSRPGTIITEVTLDHGFLMSSYHTQPERRLAEVAREMHAGADLSILVGGLGLGFTVRGRSRRRVRASARLGPAAIRLDPHRCGPRAPDEPLDSASGAFYTARGLSAVTRHLSPGGVLAVWSTDPSPAFEDNLKSVFGHVEIEIVRWWNDLIDVDKEDTLFTARRAK